MSDSDVQMPVADGNSVDTRTETVFTQDMETKHISPIVTTRCTGRCADRGEHVHGGIVAISTVQAQAAVAALMTAVAGTDAGNCDTWHGGLGTDLCEFCEALVILRSAAGVEPTDWVRP